LDDEACIIAKGETLERKPVSGIMLILLLIAMLTLAFDIQTVKSGSRIWTVNDDGPADFHMIQEAIDAASPWDTIYVYEGTYNENITINKRALTLIGENREKVIITKNLYGTEGAIVEISATDVTLSGFTILGNLTLLYPTLGIFEKGHASGTIVNNKIVSHWVGMGVGGTFNCYSNVFIGNHRGMFLLTSEMTIAYNEFYRNNYAICIWWLSNATILGNIFYNNRAGIDSWPGGTSGENNTIVGNVFAFNDVGIGSLISALSNVTVYHNDFINNSVHVYKSSYPDYGWKWDNGYPSGGNYWSDYNGTDLFSGPHQNETGSDGIGDTPYAIDAANQDNYPLMSPWTPVPDITVTNVTPSKTVVGQGYSTSLKVTVENQGGLGTFNVTPYANATLIGNQTVTLGYGTSTTLTFIWDTTGLAKGNYTISAYAWPGSGETDTADNTFTDGWVIVAMVGDISGPDGWPDGLIDIDDVILIAIAYASILGDPRYKPNCDLNDDGLIDIDDVIIPAIHYGTIDP
jgi:nitrous oxidase accessory protein NosD